MATPWIAATYQQPRAQKWFAAPESDVAIVGQRARRTASFELLPGSLAELSATRQRRTASLALDSGTLSNVSLNATRQSRVANLELTAQTPVQLSATRARRTASFDLLPGSLAELNAPRQRRTSSFDLLPGALTQLSGTRQRVTASFSIDVQNSVSLNGTRQRRTASFQILPNLLTQLDGTRSRRTASVTLVLGVAPAFTTLEGVRQRRTATITVVPFGSVTSLAAVRQRRAAQIAVDVSNDSPAELANQGRVIRWVFRDSLGGFAHVPINPREMSTPTTARNMSWAWGSTPGAVMRGIDNGPSEPTQWSFTGVSLAQSHYDLLSNWTRQLDTVQITDHLGRTFETIIQKFDPIERLPTATRDWRTDYTMTCLLLRRVA